MNVITKQKEKVVLSIRGSKQYDKEIAGRGGELRKKVLIPVFYSKANTIVCVTRALAHELHKHFGIATSRLKTIYNFYETADIIARSNENLTKKKIKYFLNRL